MEACLSPSPAHPGGGEVKEDTMGKMYLWRKVYPFILAPIVIWTFLTLWIWFWWYSPQEGLTLLQVVLVQTEHLSKLKLW